MINKYKIEVFGLVVELEFMAGSLKSITFKEPANDSNAMRLFAHLHGAEADIIKRLEQIDGKVSKIKIQSQQQKIALWCELYKMQYGIAYKVTRADAGRVKNIELTQELITAFFKSKEWYANEKTIGRYSTNYNDIKRRLLEQNTQSSSSKKATNYGANRQSNSNQQVSNQQLGEALFRRAKD